MRRERVGRVLSCIGRAMSTGGLSLVFRRRECDHQTLLVVNDGCEECAACGRSFA